MPLQPAMPPESLSVSEVVAAAASSLEAEFGDVEVEGEISNLVLPASGHGYFTLKDDSAQLRSVAWRSTLSRIAFRPENGQLVRVRGGLTVYPPRGDLQLVVRSMRLAGEGALQQAYEALRRRLEAEGLFDEARKRPLPRYPSRVGIVTSGTGAVLHDLVSVIGRRFPLTAVTLAPVRVQGDAAAEEIASAIRAFNLLPPGDPRRPDVLVVGRGGGSLEDLWAFNDERLARVIHASGIPVVSAVGHETDFTIADFVADRRAATPSMAAELVVPDRAELAAGLRGVHRRLLGAVTTRIRRGRDRLDRLVRSAVMTVPERRLRIAAQRLDSAVERTHRAAAAHLRAARARRDALSDRLRALDPMRPLAIGFALVHRDGHPVASANMLRSGDSVAVRFRDGTADMEVTGTRPGPDSPAPET
jgi:exodeoxyribonuclease VII large subunit